MLSNSKFRPAWWLRNPHAQTLWAAKVQRGLAPETIEERINTPDGDFLDLSWVNGIDHNQSNQPVVVIFHGLGGSVRSKYVQSLMHYLNANNVRAVLMHFRGCSAEPNNTPGSYHSAHTTDIRFIIDTVKNRFPNSSIAAAGYSLGGNALLKYLATEPDNPLCFAVSVSPPLLLREGAMRMNQGISKIYQRVLLETMKEAARAKHKRHPQFKLDELNFESASDFFEFDHQVTAPLHGFDSGEDYYSRASTLGDLINIKTPTHILWARDDPFFSEKCIPTNEQLSKDVNFELTSHGGHVAFVSGRKPASGYNWLCNRVGTLLTSQFDSAMKTG